MNKLHPTIGKSPNVFALAKLVGYFHLLPRLIPSSVALLAVVLMTPVAHAQTTMTFKPYQVRVEVPSGFNGTILLTNCNLRIPTNGAAGLDSTGTNWVIPDVNVGIATVPSGCTASVVDSSLNLVGTIPINLNINNTASNTNLIIKLDFDGTEPAGVSTLTFTATGAGLPDDPFLLPVEVAKIWNGGADAAVAGAGSWSDSSQWLGGIPGINDNVVFTDAGCQTNSIYGTATSTNLLTSSLIDVSTVISSLRFSQTNGTGSPLTNWHNLYINPGNVLAIAGDDGFKMLRDHTYWNVRPMMVTIYGTNATFIQTNENSSFSILSDAQQNSLLDMTGLSNLRLDIDRFYLSDYLGYPNYFNLVYTNNYSNTTAGAGKPQRFYQTWRMAQTNFVKAVYVDPDNYTNSLTRTYAMVLGHNEASGGGSGKDVEMYLGYSNVFNMDSICVGGSFCLGADLLFQNSGSYAKFRNADGVSRMSIFSTADAGGPTLAGSLGDNTKCGGNGPGVNLTGGTVDMLVDRFYLSMDRANVTASGKGVSQTSGFEFAAGTIDANTAILGYQSQGNQTNQSYCYATMIVSNTAVFKVNGTLALGYATADPGSPNNEQNGYGRINIGPGGTVMANTITVGGVTKASAGNNIAMTGGASLIVTNGIADATPNGALGTLSFGGNSSLTLFINGSNPSVPIVYVTNLTASGTGNQLIIGGVTNLSYPAYVPLIQGAGPAIDSSVFDAGVVMPEGSGLHGTLVTSSSNTIDLAIIARTPNHLLWRGPAGSTGTASWDYTSKNWLDQNTGIMTNYDNPDIVAFDDSPGYATNVLIAGGAAPLTPSAVNMTNSSVYYTFADGGNKILGSPSLNKYGTGTVEVDGNTSFSVQVNQGVLTGFNPGSIGGAGIAAGAVMNYAGNIGGSVTCAGAGTSSGSIGGTLTVLAGGSMTNAGTLANPFSVQSGGLLANASSGQMANIGVGSVGSPQVASGGTFINNGVVGAIGGGQVLYVNGTFEDLGGGNIQLNSVTIGTGAMFIPGGDSIGTTTINSDGTGTFPGAALLVQGSTNIFKVTPGSTANTVLNVNYLSFGGSASAQTQNGCTLQLNKVGANPFSAGQTFQLFKNVYGNPVPFNTGTSTNTYPVIIPATPGAGLAWNLRNLWVNGSIGVVAANSGPTFTNSFFGDGTGTNIVGQFSWDPSLQGYRLQSLVTPNTVGLAIGTNYNWTGIAGSWTNTSMTLTNVIGTNSVFYRLVFP